MIGGRQPGTLLDVTRSDGERDDDYQKSVPTILSIRLYFSLRSMWPLAK